MIERLEKLVELKAGGVRKAFASKIGVGQQTFNNYMNGTRSVTLEVINSTLNTFPELSAEWLIRGEGEMLISDNLPKFHGEETDAELELHAEIARKEIEIQKLTDEINRIKHEYIRLESLKDYFENRCDEQAETIHTLRDELSKYTPKDTQEKEKILSDTQILNK